MRVLEKMSADYIACLVIIVDGEDARIERESGEIWESGAVGKER